MPTRTKKIYMLLTSNKSNNENTPLLKNPFGGGCGSYPRPIAKEVPPVGGPFGSVVLHLTRRALLFGGLVSNSSSNKARIITPSKEVHQIARRVHFYIVYCILYILLTRSR